jgi:L-arabinose isomerase
LQWSIHTEYDHRFTEAHKHLRDLNAEVDLMQKQYAAFVRTRQAATQSYEGYDGPIRRLRHGIKESGDKVKALMARQGHQIEAMAVDELRRRRDRLSEFQIKARFAMADSYDRATTTQTGEDPGQ